MAAKRDRQWIKGAIGKPGALHEDLGVPTGKTIPRGKLEAAAAQGGVVGRRARLAETLEGFHDKGKSAKEVARNVKRNRKRRKRA